MSYDEPPTSRGGLAPDLAGRLEGLRAFLTGVGAKYSLDAVLNSNPMAPTLKVFDRERSQSLILKGFLVTARGPASAADASLLRARCLEFSHPSFAQVLDVGRAGEFMYCSYSYVKGSRLVDRISYSGSLPIREAARVGMVLARGLDDLHKHGLVHGDVKPAHILMSPGGPVLLALGVAAAYHVTTGGWLGTPAYMSPERFESRQLGPEADVFSLGMVLHELTTGYLPRLPHLGITLETSLSPLLGATLPAALWSIISRALQTRPEDRPNAEHIAQSLQHWLEEMDQSPEESEFQSDAGEMLGVARRLREHLQSIENRLDGIAASHEIHMRELARLAAGRDDEQRDEERE